MKMKLLRLSQEFSICKLKDLSMVDWSDPFCFLGKTDQELSLVCSSDSVPLNAVCCDSGWRAFRIEGVLDFSLIGILAKISALLAEQKIGIFVVSTYQTDYVLIKAGKFEEALNVLKDAGYDLA